MLYICQECLPLPILLPDVWPTWTAQLKGKVSRNAQSNGKPKDSISGHKESPIHWASILVWFGLTYLQLCNLSLNPDTSWTLPQLHLAKTAQGNNIVITVLADKSSLTAHLFYTDVSRTTEGKMASWITTQQNWRESRRNLPIPVSKPNQRNLEEPPYCTSYI